MEYKSQTFFYALCRLLSWFVEQFENTTNPSKASLARFMSMKEYNEQINGFSP